MKGDSVEQHIAVLKSNGYTLESIAVVFGVRALTVYRWAEGINSPNKITCDKLEAMASKYKKVKK